MIIFKVRLNYQALIVIPESFEEGYYNSDLDNRLETKLKPSFN